MAGYMIQSEIGPKRKAIYARTRKGAAEKLAEALTNRDRGLLFDAESLTVGAHLSRWLNDSVRGSVKPVTFASYAGLVKKHIISTVGRVKVDKLSPAHLQALYRWKLNENLSAHGPIHHVVINWALKQALRWGLVARNVAEAVDRPKVMKEYMKPLSSQQARQLLIAAASYSHVLPDMQESAACAMEDVMRSR